MKLLTALILLITLALTAWQAKAAGIPATINYQGTLVDKAGVPVGTVAAPVNKDLTFRLYSVSSGGTAFWSETQQVVITNGLFSVVLGSVTPIDIGAFGGDTWLGIQVGTDPAEMSPRQKLTSVPYAFNGSPIGTVNAFAGTTAPPGWLLCDGRSFPVSLYPALYAVIGTAHGATKDAQNKVTAFNIPDYRGRFLRGVDYSPNVTPTETGNDPDRNDTSRRTAAKTGGNVGNTVGSVQSDEFGSHTHPTSFIVMLNSINSAGSQYENGYVMSMNPNTGSAGGSETRPKNAYVNWIIKY